MKIMLNIGRFWMLWFVAPLLAATCKKDSEYCHTKIPFHNSSEKDTYVTTSFSYPDTADIASINNLVTNAGWTKAWKGAVNNRVLSAIIRPICWEVEFETSIPSDTLVVFVLDAERIELAAKNVPAQWSDDMLLRRYDLSLEDLQRLDFQLYYPPTAIMRDVKMYPAYGTE